MNILLTIVLVLGCTSCVSAETVDLAALVKSLQSQIDALQDIVKAGFASTCKSHAKDCADLLATGKNTSGVYTVYPNGKDPLNVYCDMDTDGGGWLLIRYARACSKNEDFIIRARRLAKLSGTFYIVIEWLSSSPNKTYLPDLYIKMYIETITEFDRFPWSCCMQSGDADSPQAPDLTPECCPFRGPQPFRFGLAVSTLRLNNYKVIQRRKDGKENFYRSYHDYEVGFGNVTDELYIGNKNIHDITSQCTYKLKVILTDFQNNTKTADYKSFSVGDSQSRYTLHVSGYSGDAGDSLAFDHDGHAFSAPDADNDGAKSVNCAQKHHGGYWYSNCFKSNINGAWGKAGETGIIWGSYKSWQLYVLKETTMMVKPVNCS